MEKKKYEKLNYRVVEVLVETLSILIPIFGLIIIYVAYLLINKMAGIKCVQCGLHDLMSNKSIIGSIFFAYITSRLTRHGLYSKANIDLDVK